MPTHDVLDTAQRLHAQQQPFALVSVLRVQAPASAKPGDKAVVTEQGIVAGWIGGGCAQPAVLKTVQRALADGRARLVRISPADDGSVRELGDVLEFGMACHSGGTLELFVDPVQPVARLLVLGDTPLAQALATLAPHVGLVTELHADFGAATAAPLPAGAFVVVATQGRRDLPGLRAALAAQPRQIFFVASARKAQVLKAALVEAGADAAAVQRIVAPAGQPIGAQTPQEIALSVLAAVVAARRGALPADAAEPTVTEPATRAAPAAIDAPPVAMAAQAAATVTAADPPPAAAARAAAVSPLPLPMPLPLPPVTAGGSCCSR